MTVDLLTVDFVTVKRPDADFLTVDLLTVELSDR